ncbi:MAG: hypothetical protein PHG66_01815 [Candidatus Colwellbacteria bacterium]|nr:hypothetical protein [Candidatus Colwellbacteria bacterium]
MNIDFVEEPENELVSRKNLYINPDSELSLTLSRVQDALDSNGFPLDRSNYKYVKGKLCKFQIELISSPDLALLTKRTNSLKKLNININKMKWDFSESGRSYFMKIGKIQDKDLHIVVASFESTPTEDDHEKVKDIRDKAIRNETDDVLDINQVEEDEGEILLPMKLLNDVNPIPKSEIPQHIKPIRPSIQRISPVVKPPQPIRQPPVQPIRQPPVQESTGIISMNDIQTQHNRAIGRAGVSNSTIRPVVSAQQYTQNAQSTTSRTIPARQTTFLTTQPQISRTLPTERPQSQRIVTDTTPAASMPKPNIVLYQNRQLQALSGNKPITSFKIRE